MHQSDEHHNERYTDPGEDGYTGTFADYEVALVPARSLRPGQRLQGGSEILRVDNVDGFIEVVTAERTGFIRASALVEVRS